MANLRDIRQRIRSVKNTSQVTRAMQLVAASKMKVAQQQAKAGREYAQRLADLLKNLTQSTDFSHSLLNDKETKGKKLVVVISTDRGLCGPINTNLLRQVLVSFDEKVEFFVVGNKLKNQLIYYKRKVVREFKMQDPISYQEAQKLMTELKDYFLSGSYSEVYVAFNQFVSTLKQEPTVKQFLPIVEIKSEKTQQTIPETQYLFEPEVRNILNTFLPKYLDFQIYQMLVESRASEHSSRMVAMKTATDNADEMIKSLTLDYNKLRQATITAELLEISTAQKALE